MVEKLSPDTINTAKLILKKEFPEGTSLYTFDFEPYLAVLNVKGLMVLIGACFELANPISLDALKKMKKGDLMSVRVTDHQTVFDKWKPPKDLIPGKDFHKLFRVFAVLDNGKDAPTVALESTD